MLKAVVFLYVFHIVYTGVFTGVMISAILLKINYIRGLYVMNELVKEIEQLKKEKNAVILAHYYVNDEVQEIADYIGDSYYLAKVAREVDAKTIVFCGVSFMGESAKNSQPEQNCFNAGYVGRVVLWHIWHKLRISKKCVESMTTLRLYAT